MSRRWYFLLESVSVGGYHWPFQRIGPLRSRWMVVVVVVLLLLRTRGVTRAMRRSCRVGWSGRKEWMVHGTVYTTTPHAGPSRLDGFPLPHPIRCTPFAPTSPLLPPLEKSRPTPQNTAVVGAMSIRYGSIPRPHWKKTFTEAARLRGSPRPPPPPGGDRWASYADEGGGVRCGWHHGTRLPAPLPTPVVFFVFPLALVHVGGGRGGGIDKKKKRNAKQSGIEKCGKMFDPARRNTVQ